MIKDRAASARHQNEKQKKLSADTITRMLATGRAGSMVIIDNGHSLDFSNIKELGYDTIEININNKERTL